MNTSQRSLSEMRWLFALKLVDTFFTGFVLYFLFMYQEMQLRSYFILYAVLFAFSIAALMLRWGSIVPCVIVGVLFSELSGPVTGHGSEQEAVAEAMLFMFFPIAGLIVGILDEQMLARRRKSTQEYLAESVLKTVDHG